MVSCFTLGLVSGAWVLTGRALGATAGSAFILPADEEATVAVFEDKGLDLRAVCLVLATGALGWGSQSVDEDAAVAKVEVAMLEGPDFRAVCLVFATGALGCGI